MSNFNTGDLVIKTSTRQNNKANGAANTKVRTTWEIAGSEYSEYHGETCYKLRKVGSKGKGGCLYTADELELA